jgi:hypothetical protein
VRQLPGRLPRWRAIWLLTGRPLVLLPLAYLLIVALVQVSALPLVMAAAALLLGRLVYGLVTGGVPVTARTQPELRRLVLDAASAAGVPARVRVGLVRRPVVEARVFGRPELLIGAPLVQRLTPEELRALVAHELSVLSRPALEVILHRIWIRSVDKIDPGRYAARVIRELDEHSAEVEQYADHAAGHVTDPDTAARAAARTWLVATAEGMPVRTVEWSPSLALRLSRRHPDLTEALLALVGTELTTAPTTRAPATAAA